MKNYYWISISLLFFFSCKVQDKEQNKEQARVDKAFEYYNQGVTSFTEKDYAKALDLFNKAIELDSTQSDFYINRGSMKSYLSDTLGARLDYYKALELDSTNAMALNNIGCNFSEQKKDRKAIEYFQRSMYYDSDYPPVYYNCARSQYDIRDYENAMTNFKKYCEYIKEPWSHYYMGMIYKHWKQPDKAMEEFRIAQSLGSQEAESELGKLK